jgi:hypothetical protein
MMDSKSEKDVKALKKLRKRKSLDYYKEIFVKYPRTKMKRVKKAKGQINLKGEKLKYLEIKK